MSHAPWTVIEVDDEWAEIYCPDFKLGPFKVDVARRIALSVNACAGLSNEELEKMIAWKDSPADVMEADAVNFLRDRGVIPPTIVLGPSGFEMAGEDAELARRIIESTEE